MTDEIWNKFRTGEIDINDQELFLSILLKGMLYDLNRKLSLRGKGIPHYILNTGDDIFYLESKGYDHSKEPIENTNEDYVYNVIPRCMVQPAGLSMVTDQLTSPYTTGRFEVTYDDSIYNFVAEFRRMPIKLSVSLKYVLDNFTDALRVSQQLMSRMAFINDFNISYLGNVIESTYTLPADVNTEFNMEFDGLESELKTRSIDVDFEIESNIPIIKPRTLIPADRFIREMYQVHDGTDAHSHPGDLKEKLKEKEDEIK